MRTALVITLLWAGAALLFVAFHPLAVESGSGRPGDIMHSLQAEVAKQNSAYAESTAYDAGEGTTGTVPGNPAAQ